MSAFKYRNGELRAEDVPLSRIAAEVGTPFYCYSSAAIATAYADFAEALEGLDAEICYALKANSNLAVVRTLAGLGAGADVVSEGELLQARLAGIDPRRIVFSGVGKTREAMAAAIDADIRQFNAESMQELEVLAEVADARGRFIDVGIRVNPDVDAMTHAKITTGRRENKFGIAIAQAGEAFALAKRLPCLRPAAVAVHIGSQLTDLAPFRRAFRRIADLVEELRAAGHEIHRVDLGGGLGITYRDESPPSLNEYGGLVRGTVGHLGCRLMFEPGRVLVANAGVLVSRVLYVKEGAPRFVVVDAAMNDFLRPTLYDAWHRVRPVREPGANARLEPADVVGPVCETGDSFAAERMLPSLTPDDLVAIDDAGAYGAAMASNYNMRPLVPEVLVKGKLHAVVRSRQRMEDLLARDELPPWFTSSNDVERGAA